MKRAVNPNFLVACQGDWKANTIVPPQLASEGNESNVCLNTRGGDWSMTHRHSQTETERISSEISRLFELKVSALKQQWRDVYGNEPPPRASKKLLASAIAYKIQERAFGGLKPSIIRLLERASEEADGRQIPRRFTRASTGTVLIREWQGKSHHVTVLERGGVLYRTKSYRSLSQVARVITGCRWSGPLFFGLRGRSKGGSRGTR